MKIIDKYNLNTRLYPMVIFCLPILLLCVIFSFPFDKYINIIKSISIIGPLSFFVQQIVRDAGKNKEKALWEAWGGPPTTQILRWRDKTLDIITKRRYHLKLQELYSSAVVPNANFEHEHPAEADEIYEAYVKYLRTKTRDTKKYSLLFIENINYGYRRNLWGMKSYAITLLIFLILANFGYFFCVNKYLHPNNFLVNFFLGESMLIIFISFWIVKVNANWVRIPANVYAERLLESVENLKKETVKLNC